MSVEKHQNIINRFFQSKHTHTHMKQKESKALNLSTLKNLQRFFPGPFFVLFKYSTHSAGNYNDMQLYGAIFNKTF